MDVPVSGAYGCETARVVLKSLAAHSRLALRNLKFNMEACGGGQYHNKSSTHPRDWPEWMARHGLLFERMWFIALLFTVRVCFLPLTTTLRAVHRGQALRTFPAGHLLRRATV